MKRYAIIRNARSLREVEAYLPDNYRVIYEGLWTRYPDSNPRNAPSDTNVFVIEGEDALGWTLEGYVVPRYASGLIWVEEIDLSHPIMKEIPA